MYQRGGVGIPVVIAIVGGVIVFAVGYSLIGGMRADDLGDEQIVNTENIDGDLTPEKARSLVSFDNNFFQSGNDFYFRIETGGAADGGQQYKYVKANIADAKTFHKVPVLGGTEAGAKAGIGAGAAQGSGVRPAFYMDSQHVYFFSGTSIEVIASADPGTFQVLSPTYAIDQNNVYVINTSCDTSGDCTGTLAIVPGADPETFQTFHETEVPDPDGSGTVTIDASDSGNIYYYGIWVGPLPDPDDHSLHPETNNPVLISP